MRSCDSPVTQPCPGDPPVKSSIFMSFQAASGASDARNIKCASCSPTTASEGTWFESMGLLSNTCGRSPPQSFTVSCHPWLASIFLSMIFHANTTLNPVKSYNTIQKHAPLFEYGLVVSPAGSRSTATATEVPIINNNSKFWQNAGAAARKFKASASAVLEARRRGDPSACSAATAAARPRSGRRRPPANVFSWHDIGRGWRQNVLE